VSIHVFIATTRGLVAINSIYPLDASIRSVVSIGGTSKLSPITNTYINYVGKAAGIIEDDFGHGSYRVNISDQIDQGESWQLGFYIAHAAAALDCLGDGNPQAGDKILCATGIVDTSQRKVLGVNEIPTKIQLASAQLRQWQTSHEVQFLLPKANEDALPENDDLLGLPIECISELDDIRAYLPSAAAGQKPVVSNSTVLPVAQVNEQRHGKNNVLWSAGAAVVVAFSLWFGYNYLQVPVDEPQIKASTEVSVTDKQGEQSTKSQITGRVDQPSVQAKEAISVSLFRETSQNCNNRTSMSKEVLTQANNIFITVEVDSTLCTLRGETLGPVEQVLFIGVGDSQLEFRSLPAHHFDVPQPKKTNKSRSYFLIALSENLTQEQRDKLKEALGSRKQRTGLSTHVIQEILKNLNKQAVVYQHQLTFKNW
jgi:hypothetical protein